MSKQVHGCVGKLHITHTVRITTIDPAGEASCYHSAKRGENVMRQRTQCIRYKPQEAKGPGVRAKELEAMGQSRLHGVI